MAKKNIIIIVFVCYSLFTPITSLAASWKPQPPEGFMPITWVGANGIASFMRAPVNAGYIDYLTVIHLPSTQVQLIASSVPKEITGPAAEPFPTDLAQNWLFTRGIVETFKTANPDVRFLWDMPFFSVTNLTTPLALSLKSVDATGPYITSGYRSGPDMAIPRRMLIIDNTKGLGKVVDFDVNTFLAEGDQAVEGFHPLQNPSEKDVQATRLYVGVRREGTELVIYCSSSASHKEASDALVAAGVPVENQIQGDGGGSATCAYNLPGQYFVEPGRALPHVMGATPIVLRGTTTIDKLNVRNGPTASNTSVRQLSLGTSVIAYEEKNGWLKISKDNEWVSAKYVKKTVVLPYLATVMTSGLNVRSGAGTTFGVTRRLPLGTVVSVLEEKTGWVRISETEWISASHIK